jgi:hypothetical protein
VCLRVVLTRRGIAVPVRPGHGVFCLGSGLLGVPCRRGGRDACGLCWMADSLPVGLLRVGSWLPCGACFEVFWPSVLMVVRVSGSV